MSRSGCLLAVIFAVTSPALARAEPAQPTLFVATPGDALDVTATDSRIQLAGVAATFEAGFRVHESALWVHTEIGTSALGSDFLFGTRGGASQDVRIGVEKRSCAAGRQIGCAFLGVDAGYRHTHVDTYSGDGFDSTVVMSTDDHSPIVVGRAGVDFGMPRGLRVRPQVEVVADEHGFGGFAAGLGLAAQW